MRKKGVPKMAKRSSFQRLEDVEREGDADPQHPGDAGPDGGLPVETAIAVCGGT